MWNRRSLLRACEGLLEREDCSLRLRTISEPATTAHGSYSDSKQGPINIILTTDPAKGGLIECFLHEALHIVLASEIGDRFNIGLEEIQICALERELWMKFKKKDTARWRRLINAKLG